MAEPLTNVQAPSPQSAPRRAWFVARCQERVGPMAEEELRAMAARREVAPGTLVWSEGMSAWTPAHSAVDGLFPGHPPQGAPALPPAAPPTVRSGAPLAPSGSATDATGGLIPYKNGPALAAYYAGVFSVIPFFPIGLTALVLGIKGLKKRAREPAVRGAAHAWIGIIVGGFFGVLWLAGTVALIVAIVRAS